MILGIEENAGQNEAGGTAGSVAMGRCRPCQICVSTAVQTTIKMLNPTDSWGDFYWPSPGQVKTRSPLLPTESKFIATSKPSAS
jgi:hypothetical protein